MSRNQFDQDRKTDLSEGAEAGWSARVEQGEKGDRPFV